MFKSHEAKMYTPSLIVFDYIRIRYSPCSYTSFVHDNTELFVYLNLQLPNVRNYYKLRNVSPSCKAFIPFTDLAILFGPFRL